VSEQDNAIPLDAERFLAEQIGVTTESVEGSHTAFIARSVHVAQVTISARGAAPVMAVSGQAVQVRVNW
jgi:hypothetical protein